MIKNVLEPSCMKWWCFPQHADVLYSIRYYPDAKQGRQYVLLSMEKPREIDMINHDDWKVEEWDFPCMLGESDPEMLAILEKHFGIKLA